MASILNLSKLRTIYGPRTRSRDLIGTSTTDTRDKPIVKASDLLHAVKQIRGISVCVGLSCWRLLSCLAISLPLDPMTAREI